MVYFSFMVLLCATTNALDLWISPPWSMPSNRESWLEYYTKAAEMVDSRFDRIIVEISYPSQVLSDGSKPFSMEGIVVTSFFPQVVGTDVYLDVCLDDEECRGNWIQDDESDAIRKVFEYVSSLENAKISGIITTLEHVGKILGPEHNPYENVSEYKAGFPGITFGTIISYSDLFIVNTAPNLFNSVDDIYLDMGTVLDYWERLVNPSVERYAERIIQRCNRYRSTLRNSKMRYRWSSVSQIEFEAMKLQLCQSGVFDPFKHALYDDALIPI